MAGVLKYGRRWVGPDGSAMTDLDIELRCFYFGYEHGFDKEAHFWNIVQGLWGVDKAVYFARHPWAEDMTHAACHNNYVAITGCGSSGKSEWAAMWALVNWLCAPHETLVLCTSTTMQEGRKRIWSKIRKFYQAIPGLPGKLIEHPSPQIKLPKLGDTTGITLLPGQPSKAREAVSKLIGLKQNRVIFIADELSELSEAILEACTTNLNLNPFFQLIGLSNAKSYFDPFGLLAQPKNGWGSINVGMSTWETARGVALHFDGEKSPNLAHDKDIWPIYGHKQLKEHKALGENSPGYWRQCRGFWCPTGNTACIYTEADLLRHNATRRVTQWFNAPQRIAGFDPAFTTGGDRSIVYFGMVGDDMETNQTVVCLDEYIELKADVTIKDKPTNFQFAEQFRDECIKRGIQPNFAGLDSTNIPFADIVSQVWSNDVLRVAFGGAASDFVDAGFTPRPGNELYANRVTQLWFAGKKLLDTDQLCGIRPEMAREMCERVYSTVKRGDHMMSLAESKEAMRNRISRSPDIADAAFVLIEVAKQRLHVFGGKKGYEQSNVQWKQQVQRFATHSNSPLGKFRGAGIDKPRSTSDFPRA